MGATRNTGYLENLIAYDASDNVAIATSVNPSYKVTLGGSLLGTSATFNVGSATTVLGLTGNGNGATIASITNTDTGSSARSSFQVTSDSATAHYFASSTTNVSSAIGGRASTAGIFTASGDTAGGLAFLARNAAGVITFHTGGNTERVRIAAGGNVGIGTTPAAWVSTSRALQLPTFVSLSTQHNGALNLMSCAYESSANTFLYADTGVYPTRINMNPNDGSITFFGAGTGTAGNAITWASRLAFTSTGAATFSGDVLVTNSSNAQIGFNTTGALNTTGAYQYYNRSGSNKWTAGMGPLDGSDDYQIVTAGIKALNLKVSTGAATFSSTIDAGGDITVSKSGDAGINLNSTTTNGVAVTRYKTTAAGNLWGTGINITAGDSRWEVYNFGLTVSPFRLSNSTGAATFSANSTTVELNTSSRALKITGKDNFYAIEYTGGTTTGQSYGPYIKAGTNSSDQSFVVQNSAGNKDYLTVRGDGNVLIGKNTTASATVGINLEGSTGFGGFTRGSGAAILVNRQNDDGNLVDFLQADTTEGSISVSGTTVSYNGGHLARYSQTESGQRVEGLLKGTVMSNLDKMAEWINPETGQPYANEQLNCMKISDVEGDINVAGVFVNWDEDDKTFTNDMNIAMTGDMIIRIAKDVVVEKGQLLMSAGDGTAKPQGDDIIKSKTIAKVTSNHVTCVYEDGSYCVPCVLMAC